MNEPVILVDKDDNEVGIVDRSAAETDQNAIVRMAYVLLYHVDGRVLLQRRRPDLKRYPNYWTVSCTGAVHPGEGYVEAAARKLKEELGLELPLEMARKDILRIPAHASYMTAIFVGSVDDLAMTKLDASRVQEVRWLRLEEAREGYLLTPTCDQILTWWFEHGKEFVK